MGKTEVQNGVCRVLLIEMFDFFSNLYYFIYLGGAGPQGRRVDMEGLGVESMRLPKSQ